MDGVMILNTFMKYSDSSAAILFFSCGLCITGIVAGFVMIYSDYSYYGSIVLISAGIWIMIGLFSVMPKNEFIQAVVDESVPWVELTDRYEVVKIDGRIVTMIEKVKKEEDQK